MLEVKSLKIVVRKKTEVPKQDGQNRKRLPMLERGYVNFNNNNNNIF